MDDRGKSNCGAGDAGRCKKQQSKKRYARKRKNPNKGKKLSKTPLIPSSIAGAINITADLNTNPVDIVEVPGVETASTKKIIDLDHNNSNHDQSISGFRFVEMSIISTAISILACPFCFDVGHLKLSEDLCQKKGLSSSLVIRCSSCHYNNSFQTSPEVTNCKKRGPNPMEINVRAVYGCRSIGVGFSQMTKLFGYLNMPSPMTQATYDNLADGIKSACKVVAEESMSEAAAELRHGKKSADIGVSVDGT